ncbi:MAG: MFS transporter [Lachnospiraceae bacterium]|nr:MFS transporter [Lachnospiraceae bacterium]
MNDRGKTTGMALAATILSASFLQTMASSATSPVLSMIKAEFSEAAMSTVQLTMTLPSVFIMLVSMFVTGLLKRFSLKTLTLSGILLYLAGGIGGIFVRSLLSLLILRSIMGIGLGLFCPMLSILISESFEGQQRTNMMGYLQSFNFLGGMAGTAIGGMLAASGWRNAFWVYLFGVPAFVMAAVCIKDTGKQGPDKERGPQAASAKAATPMASWFLGIVMMLHGILLFKVPLSASTLFAGLGINDPGKSGMAVAVLYGGSFLAGLFMGTIRKILKRAAFPCACLLLGLAFFLLAICASESYILIGAFLLGFGSGVFAPMLYALAPEMIPPQAIPATMTILNAALYLGMFLSPYASVLIRSAGVDSPAFDFFTAVGCELVFAVIAAWLMFRKPSERAGSQTIS